jgi:hypothetical protein
MNTMVDPRKVAQLSNDFLALKRIIEDRETGLNNEMKQMLARTRSQYHEHYVRSAVSEVEQTLGEIRRLSAALTAQLHTTASSLTSAAGIYQKVEEQAKSLMDQAKTFMEEGRASDAWDRYDNTIGRAGELVTAMGRTASAGILGLLGFQYANLNGFRQFQLLDDIAAGRLKIPVGSLIQKVEASRFNSLARFLVNPLTLFKYKDKGLAELIYKSFTKIFPSDVANLTNTVQEFRKGLRSSTTAAGAMNVVKSSSGTLLKNALRVGKGNAITAGIITAGVETVGASLRIAENRVKYADNPEKLKEENAKAIGQAVYKTTVITGTSVAGATIFGAIGSLAGPGGTVAGAAFGGFVGSWVGEVICEKTAGWVDSASVAVMKAGEAVKDAAQAGFNEVKKQATKLADGAKEALDNVTGFFGKLKFP